MTKKTRPRPPSSPASVSRSRPTSITTTTKSTSPRPASITTTSSFKAQNPGLQWKSLLLPGDKFMQIVKLEGEYLDHVRYLCIVSHNEEFFLLGVDEDNEDSRSQPTIGLVCKMIHGMKVTLDGDGGFTYHHHLDKHRQLIFKPVSVQALWTVIQTLHEIGKRLQPVNTNPEQSEDWINQYKINSPQSCVNEWHTMADVLVRRPPSPHRTPRIQRLNNRSEINADFQIVIKNRLRQIMKSSNLDTITSKRIRAQLESDLGQNLEEHKSFIDTEILQILGQMDPASKILDYLYLGSEWNAGNLEELHANGITHILNVTREIDNFFPADFKYKNIRVYDEESTNLRKYFDDSYRFIKDAKDQNGKVLVHCKMGISRSASCTIAYIMKEYGNELTSAMQHAKDRRSIVNPNKSFKKQLEVYDGMLSAFRQRTNYQRRLFRSKSEHAIPIESSTDHDDLHGITKDIDIKKIIPNFLDQHGHPGIITDRPTTTSSSSALLSPLSSHQGIGHVRHRPKSWSPNDQVTHFLLDQADRISKSATADNVVDDCSHIYNISELMPSSPVNAVNNVIDPNCDCNVELELSVPAEPVSVSRQNDSGDVETDLIVQRLSQLPIQMRTSNSLLDDLRTSSTPGGSVASSVSSTTSVPTTPIFALKRRGSVDSTVWSSKPPPNPPPMPPPAPPAPPQSSHGLPTINSEVLSVKTLANMFDFKVSPIPLRPCSARLEDNHIFQRMAKQLDNNTDNSGSTFVTNLSQSNPL